MPPRLASRLAAFVSFAGLLGLAAPALASERQDLLSEALGADATPLSDAEMGDLRGGAGLFGGALQPGSSTYTQIGSNTSQTFSPGNPSSTSTNVTSGGTTLSASASIGPAGPPQSLTFTKTFSTNSSVSTSRSFSFTLKL
jgi:hypothetical protein